MPDVNLAFLTALTLSKNFLKEDQRVMNERKRMSIAKPKRISNVILKS
jgi:hypothetical protein